MRRGLCFARREWPDQESLHRGTSQVKALNERQGFALARDGERSWHSDNNRKQNRFHVLYAWCDGIFKEN